MRKIVKILALTAIMLITMPAVAQSMKMVIDTNTGEAVGRLVKITPTAYVIDVQDTGEINKAPNLKVVTFSAKNGQGVIYRNDYVKVNVRKGPGLNYPVVAQIANEQGCVPEAYPCLGKVKGWYKTTLNGVEGYVLAKLVQWDGMDTF